MLKPEIQFSHMKAKNLREEFKSFINEDIQTPYMTVQRDNESNFNIL